MAGNEVAACQVQKLAVSSRRYPMYGMQLCARVVAGRYYKGL